jgi:hypothetical protein
MLSDTARSRSEFLVPFPTSFANSRKRTCDHHQSPCIQRCELPKVTFAAARLFSLRTARLRNIRMPMPVNADEHRLHRHIIAFSDGPQFMLSSMATRSGIAPADHAGIAQFRRRSVRCRGNRPDRHLAQPNCQGSVPGTEYPDIESAIAGRRSQSANVLASPHRCRPSAVVVARRYSQYCRRQFDRLMSTLAGVPYHFRFAATLRKPSGELRLAPSPTEFRNASVKQTFLARCRQTGLF